MDDGLFGPTPAELHDLRNQQVMKQAQQYAGMSANDASKAAFYGAGAQLGQAFGGVRPADVEMQKRNELMAQGDADLSTSKGLYAKAEQFRQSGDQRTAMMLMMKGKELERQEQAAMAAAQKQSLAERKQDFQENESMQLKRDQLAQQFEVAKMRSEDVRLAAADRAAAAREANQIRLEIARMAAASKAQPNIMTPAQAFKQQQAMVKSSGALKEAETVLSNATAAAEALKSHPGLERATGISGVFPSLPGGKAAEAETLLDEFKNQVKLIGLNLSRQGGGLGAMTEREWPIVEGMVANIDPKKLSAQGVKDQIDKVIAKMQATLANAREIHSTSFGGEQQATPSAPKEEIWVRKNGKLVKG